MANNTTLTGLVQADINALNGTQTLAELLELKVAAVKLGMDTSAIDTHLDALDMTNADTPTLMENAVANALGGFNVPVESGQLVTTLTNTLGGKPVLEADGSLIDPVAHPNLDTILNDTYTPIGWRDIVNGQEQGQFAASDDGSVVLCVYRNSTGSKIEVWLVINGVLSHNIEFSVTGGYSLADSPTVSADGTKGGVAFYEAGPQNIKYVYINGGTSLASGNLHTTYVAQSYFASCWSRDGLVAYTFYADDVTNELIVEKSTNGGITWVKNTVTVNALPYGIVAACCSNDGSTIYLVNNYGSLFKSTDSGVSFTDSALLTGGPSYSDMMECDSTGQYVIYRKTSLFYLSNDYGVTFNEVDYGKYFINNSQLQQAYIKNFCIRRTDNRIFLISSAYEVEGRNNLAYFISYSDDGGVTWTHGNTINYTSSLSLHNGFSDTPQCPFWVSADNSKMLGIRSTNQWVVEIDLSHGKHLPLLPAKKIVGG